MARYDQPDGILVVDKPEDMTSAKLVAMVKRLLNVKKVGHTGTLDPFATGVLVCCINRATRLTDFLKKDHKKYEGILYLGISTDTQDKTGAVVSERKDVHFSSQTLKNVMKRFEGETKQIPPVYSALKHKGIPLYKLARAGKPVQKPARKIFISSMNILDVRLPEIRFEISCSSGTYVRTVCSDIGDALGCGGHLKELRRTESNGFSISEALSLSEMQSLAMTNDLEHRLISMRDALRHLPECRVTDELAEKIKNGGLIAKTQLHPKEEKQGLIKIIDEQEQLIAVLKHVNELPHYQYCCVLTSSSGA